jgi:uncharacterized protein YndB with AHSA1/START domain
MISRALLRNPAAFVLALLVSAASGSAEVADVGENGFTARETATLSVPPAKAYAAMLEVGKWWGSDHTFSGDASNMSLEARPGGCWCERLPSGGGVLHMTVALLIPGRMVHLIGGLGPLQSMGVSGSMEWKFDPAENGTTKVELRYTVGGYNPGGFKQLAPGVESVLKTQFEAYKRYAETGKR